MRQIAGKNPMFFGATELSNKKMSGVNRKVWHFTAKP
jgi:hypothetical protein